MAKHTFHNSAKDEAVLEFFSLLVSFAVGIGLTAGLLPFSDIFKLLVCSLRAVRLDLRLCKLENFYEDEKYVLIVDFIKFVI